MINEIRRKLTNALTAMSLYLATPKVQEQGAPAPVLGNTNNPNTEGTDRSSDNTGRYNPHYDFREFKFVPDSERQNPMSRLSENLGSKKLPIFEIKPLPEDYVAPWEKREPIYKQFNPYVERALRNFDNKLEGILVGIKKVSSSTTSDASQVTAQSLGTELTILVQEGFDHEGRQREVTVNFPGIVLNDSVGNWVVYDKFLGLGLSDVFKIFPENRNQCELATLEDKDLKRKYSGSTETRVEPAEIYSKSKYGSLRCMTQELGHMYGGK